MLRIKIPGEPVAQGRPRFSMANGFPRAYDPAKSRTYKAHVRILATQAMNKARLRYTDQAVIIYMTFILPIPKSKPKKFKEAAMAGKTRPTTRPDLDNLFKGVSDALSGVVYHDDKQIVACFLKKLYGANAGVIVDVLSGGDLE